MMQRARSGSRPVRSLSNTWESVSACKHYIPPGRKNSDGNLIDVKGGVIIQPQTGYAFESDADRFAVRSTCLSPTEPTVVLASGAWTPVLAEQYCLVLTAGYMNTELSVSATPPDYCRTIRTAFGDVNNYLELDPTGFGLSDGVSDRVDPAASASNVAHVVYKNIYTLASREVDATSTASLGDQIHAVCGTTIPFFRYALTRPDNYTIVSGAHRADTGAEILTNDEQYGSASATFPLSDTQFPPAFRMHGFWTTGIAMFLFDALPPDYLLAANVMSAAWCAGDEFVWPYWG